MQTILLFDFAIIIYLHLLQQAKKNLTKAIQHGAKKASETAVKNLIKKPLSIGIKTGIQKDVAPGAKKEAKSAAEAEVIVLLISIGNHIISSAI